MKKFFSSLLLAVSALLLTGGIISVYASEAKPAKKPGSRRTTSATNNSYTFENNIGAEQKAATFYFGVPMEYITSENDKRANPGLWNVKIVNKNGTVREYKNLKPKLELFNNSPAPSNRLEQDLRDVYYIKLNIPTALLGDNTVTITSPLFNESTEYTASNGGVTLTTITLSKTILNRVAINATEVIPGVGKCFDAKSCTIKVTNKNGKEKVLENIPLTYLNSLKRERLNSKDKESLKDFYYTEFSLPASFAGSNTVEVITPYGKWIHKDVDFATNSKVTMYFYPAGIVK